MKKTFLIVLLALFLAPLVASAIPLNLDYPEFVKIDLNREADQKLDRLATWVYSAIVIISGLAAFVMLVWGGIRWMSSAGSPTAISDARGRIQSALLGLLLVLASFLILQVINPELTVLNIPGTPAPKSSAIPAPIPTGMLSPMVDLKAIDERGITSNGPFTLSRAGKKTAQFIFTWESRNVTKCITSGELPRIAIETQGDIAVTFPPWPASGGHTYTIQCENEESGLLPEDSVFINMVR